MTFKALLASRIDRTVSVDLVEMTTDQLMDGDVSIDVDYSTVNYKDGLALAGRPGVIQTYPLVPGIDLAGTVTASTHAGYVPGDRVVLNGWGLSQTHHGGFAQKARVSGDWLVKLPQAISTRDAMAIGTAGYTAMLAVLALEHAGVTPDRGPVLVTGAGGGVGSVAILILSRLGYRVIASTGRPEESPYLTALGAAEIIDRKALSEPGPPIASPRWIGAVDSVGSQTLANVLAQTDYRGAVAACGLAQGVDLPGSVFPFILRNVTLAGIDSVNAPFAVRARAWDRLARDLDLSRLATTVTEVGLAEVPAVGRAILEGRVRGRTVVDVNA
ncbi:MAG TPA: MDR family oxidoreductase [Caulobacter sp.]|nr:MDR family oxidoreductase [Caulobacter sp.]